MLLYTTGAMRVFGNSVKFINEIVAAPEPKHVVFYDSIGNIVHALRVPQRESAYSNPRNREIYARHMNNIFGHANG